MAVKITFTPSARPEDRLHFPVLAEEIIKDVDKSAEVAAVAIETAVLEGSGWAEK